MRSQKHNQGELAQNVRKIMSAGSGPVKPQPLYGFISKFGTFGLLLHCQAL